MLVSVCAQLFSLSAALILDADESRSQMAGKSRRVSRVKTLDGGASVLDQGFSWADATLNLEFVDLTQSQVQLLGDLVANHSRVSVSYREGFFICSPVDITEDGNQVRVSFYVVEKVD